LKIDGGWLYIYEKFPKNLSMALRLLKGKHTYTGVRSAHIQPQKRTDIIPLAYTFLKVTFKG
jgi:hypothetical protein